MFFCLSAYQKGGHFRTPFPWRRDHIEIGSVFDIHYINRLELPKRKPCAFFPSMILQGDRVSEASRLIGRHPSESDSHVLLQRRNLKRGKNIVNSRPFIEPLGKSLSSCRNRIPPHLTWHSPRPAP